LSDHLTNLSLDEGWSRSDSQGEAFSLADVLGSSVARVDANGVVKTQYTFEPFGTAQATGAADPNLAGYTGRETDASNLVFYRARYYNPALQRFISEDPADVAGGINLYAYVGNRPLDFTDPTGMNPLRQFCENVRRKIQNITKDIEKREAELLADKLKLPETCVEDLWKPSTSKRGHRKIISDLKGDLGLWEILNSLFCGGNSTPGTPQVVPELPPIPVPPPPTPQQQVVIVGAAGTAILTYWWVVVFAM
jgi:RHS repeat-associated protein